MANHSYWRLYNCTANLNAYSYDMKVAEIQMKSGGVNKAVGGTAISNYTYDPTGEHNAAKAFDGNYATFWWSYGNTGDSYFAGSTAPSSANYTAGPDSATGRWIGYAFSSPVSIDELVITPQNNIEEPFGRFILQYSDNGTTWFTYATMSWSWTGTSAPYYSKTFAVTPTVITWNSPAAGAQPVAYFGRPYSFISNVSVSNAGVGATIYSIQSGSTPSGTTFYTSNGNIIGTIPASNTNRTDYFTIRAVNNYDYWLDRAFIQDIVNTKITWNGPAGGQAQDKSNGTVYTLTPSVTVTYPSGATTYTSSGTLPVGTSLNNTTGVVSGTLNLPIANVVSSYSYTLSATNNGVTANSPVYYGNVVPLTNTVVTWLNPLDNKVYANNSTYFMVPSLSIENALGPTTFEEWGITGSLPAGTTLNANTGVVSGVAYNKNPSVYPIYQYVYVIKATNNGMGAIKYFNAYISANAAVVWNSPAAGAQPDVYAGETYTLTPNVSAPVGNATIFDLQYGALPTGTTLNANTGVVSGTLPNSLSSYSFVLRATNNNISASRLFTGNVVTNPTATTIIWNNPAGVQANVTGGTVYDFTANTTVNYPVGPTVYSILSGSIPFGTVFDSSSGTIFGVLPTAPSSYSFTIRASNNGALVDISLSGNILTPTSVSWYDINTITRSAYANNDYYASNAAVTITNPVGSTTFSLVSGSLMSGTSLDTTTGLVSGTVSVGVGTYSYTLRATNNGSTVDRLFSGNTVDLGTTVITWITPTAGALPVYGTNQPYYYFIPNITVSNPSGSTTYSIVSGSIPTGTTFNASTGEISGKNPVAGNYSFTMRATNNGKTLDRSFTSLVVSVAVTSVTWVSPSDQGTFNGNSNYNFVPSITLTSAAGPTVYSIVAGAIPSGTTFDPKTGIISGTLPNITTSYSYTMRATVYTTYSNRTFSGNVIAV